MSSFASTSGPNLVLFLFRNDLRLHDSPALKAAAAAAAKKAGSIFLPVYSFDDRFLGATGNDMRFLKAKSSPHRTNFLIQSVADLKASLIGVGSDLHITTGRPEVALPALVASLSPSSTSIFAQHEIASEEADVLSAIKSSLPGSTLTTVHGSSLYTYEDVCDTFDVSSDGLPQIPDVTTPFRTKLEKVKTIRPCLPSLSSADLSGTSFPSSLLSSPLPSPIPVAVDDRTAVPFAGGETAGKSRVTDYFFTEDRLKTYFDTRNGMIGTGYSTKFSPYLALGCLSPR